MQTKNIEARSIFNLIAIFKNTTQKVSKKLLSTNCKTNFNDDYYWDTEKSYTTK